MRLIDSMDPALDAATLALSRRAQRHASRFASIELRGAESKTGHLAPLGYALSVVSALTLVAALWML